MTVSTKSVTWPYSVKTVAIQNCDCLPFGGSNYGYYYVPGSDSAATAGVGFEIFPPLQIYRAVGLYTHFKYTFNSSIATANQAILGVSVTNQSPPFLPNQANLINNYMPLNIAATSGTVEISLDISSLLTGTPTNIIIFWFPPLTGFGVRGAGYDTVNMWKADLVYQTIGVRNEK